MKGFPSVAFAAVSLLGVAGAQGGNTPVCAGCHREVWETYRRTGMARSFYRPSTENMVEDFTARNTFCHQPSESWFTMLRRDGKYYQRRHQLDSRGKPVNVVEKRIDYIMGSGNHARTYLHRTARNTLVELPLAWYAEQGGYWAMNPGYDRPDHEGFRRPITYECMFCHNAYPRIPAGHEQPFAQSVYEGALPEGIDCERCHGQGSRHVQLAATAGARRNKPAAHQTASAGTLVNPVPAALLPEVSSQHERIDSPLRCGSRPQGLPRGWSPSTSSKPYARAPARSNDASFGAGHPTVGEPAHRLPRHTYSFREHLDNGYIAWALRRLGKGNELRPIFLRVVTECLART